MLNTIYRLVSPRHFDSIFQDMDLFNGNVVVRPTHLSICRADQRYYQGTRATEILNEKLPMALIHEGAGKVVYDPKGEFKEGEKVIMVPNTPVEINPVVAENYLRSSKFRASSLDGFMQENVSMDRNCLVRLPEGIDGSVAAFTELVSVSFHALNRLERFSHEKREAVGIWGDGNLGYITALLFKTMFPATKLYIMGVTEEKLNKFSFADETFNVKDIPRGMHIDHAVECVGGPASQTAMEQIIDFINPEGCISLLGVSEYAIPINTRMLLEKGLKLFGSSRSGKADFQSVVDIYKSHSRILGYLSNLVGEQVNISCIQDMNRAFEADQQNNMGKTIMLWNV